MWTRGEGPQGPPPERLSARSLNANLCAGRGKARVRCGQRQVPPRGQRGVRRVRHRHAGGASHLTDDAERADQINGLDGHGMRDEQLAQPCVICDGEPFPTPRRAQDVRHLKRLESRSHGALCHTPVARGISRLAILDEHDVKSSKPWRLHDAIVTTVPHHVGVAAHFCCAAAGGLSLHRPRLTLDGPGASRSTRGDPVAETRSSTFRTDVEGLRGVAVLAVVLFHANLGGLTGGFVGVDVFFVISGFLITGLLVREHAQTGAIGLAGFYARRVRRLLPAGLATLVVTLVAAVVIVAPIDRAGIAGDAAAAALSVGNVRLALASGDYFAAVSTASPFLHYWSLGVEEQFYLVWPALLLVTMRGTKPLVRLGLALAALCITSLAANIWLTDFAPNWAFYSLPTRAWQLGLGGLLAIGGGWIVERAPRLIAVLGWAGLGAITIAFVLYSEAMQYPGLAAIVPTCGAAAVMLGGTVPLGPGKVLSLAPLRFLGRISYSLYLWHWPIFALAPLVLGAPPSAPISLALIALSIAVATVSCSRIEAPFRRGFGAHHLQPRQTVAIGLTAIAVIALAASSIAAAPWQPIAPPEGSPVAVATDAIGEPSLDWADATPMPTGTGVGNETTAPSQSPVASPTSTADPVDASPGTPTPVPSIPVTIALPANAIPSIDKVRADEDRLRADGCLVVERVTTTPSCWYGAEAGTFTLALVGDSHAAQWFPAAESVANHEGWRLVVFAKVSCPFLDMPVVNLALKREYRECAAWNRNVVRRLDTLHPDLTLVTMSRTAAPALNPEDDTVAARGAALGRMLEQIQSKVAVLVDTPFAGFDVPGCISLHMDDVRRCMIPRSTAFAGGLGKIEQIAARASGASLVDLTDNICPGTGACPVVIGRIILYRDLGHLTQTFARSLAPALAAALVPIAAGP